MAKLERIVNSLNLFIAICSAALCGGSAEAAISKTSGVARKPVIIAVIDTGIDAKHSAIVKYLWKKPGAKNAEYGWDFVLNKANPGDTNGHGTHIAGIISGAAKAEPDLLAIGKNIKLMALRFYSENSTDADVIENTAKAVDYAIENGAHIINYSAGGSTFSQSELKAFARAEERGILVVAAAGNKSKNADVEKNRFFPASYGFENMISVAALNPEEELVASSNWGPKTVHIAAPGENIRSTLPGGKYGYLTGTSQGAAFVTRVAALLMATEPSLRGKPLATKAIILESAKKISELESRIASGGRLDANAALEAVAGLAKPIVLTDRIPAAGLAR